MTDDPQMETLAHELHAIRAEPDPEFARDLDRRAAEWARTGERRWRLPSLRTAVPAVAVAAAAAVALVLLTADGGDEPALAVRVVSEQSSAGEALGAAPQRDSGAQAQEEQAERAFLTSPAAAPTGEPLVAPYSIPAPARARVRLGERETRVDVPAGDGRLEISTDGLEPGRYELEIDLPPVPAQHVPVGILPRD